MKQLLLVVFFHFLIIPHCMAQDWYKMPDEKETRWVSFENRKGARGEGGKENEGAKGHAFDSLPAGESVVLLDMQGAGVIHRIWITISDRSPEMLRSLRIDMYWDKVEKPAVSAPFGDFFGVGLGQRLPFQSALFTDPEGRSFNCYIPMPFRNGARIVLTNESEKDLIRVFYDINLTRVKEHDEDVLYFHTYWNRDPEPQLGVDYEILPKVAGSGRFLGVNMGLITADAYEKSWWGEGEVKIYLDGDGKFPTLVGTGTEDYIGTAYGQGVFAHQFQGCLIADNETGRYAFYRYHIPDPVYFARDIRVTIQLMGGWNKDKVAGLIKNEAPLIPVSVHKPSGEFVKLLEQPEEMDVAAPDFPDGWVNFYRQDDVSSTAYFYLDKPENDLPELGPVDLRTIGLLTN